MFTWRYSCRWMEKTKKKSNPPFDILTKKRNLEETKDKRLRVGGRRKEGEGIFNFK